ncbi:NADP-dependent alcohol dehydrogenase C 1 [Chryseobacterium aquaeductus]|uniref:NADP-dependent alcohol dehydrogenase C 1 n=1 Tax=Chryseobacterium aquaeductus TaxID=2675056 RepID=A0A9N8QSH4_9FLAO|nr:NAD(P)-dependent alcohol dehydrogenase [Chryseobacterium aquaeductus]CAA7331332.1 NADP-dependent alcohol dehydrogenase C 1 [Chryseobacterium potabilaquae]CAD7809570.1 NADP-dependent alcohol dehydrogenase C 1 [Chryseobacterium aquaeductus]
MNTYSVKAYGTESKEADLKEMNIERREATPNDVEIEILFCGVCHSDLHTARNDWGGTKYPAVPGHEIVGRITKVGTEVSKFKVGDIAGVGCIVDSCGTCESCKKDLEQYCQTGFVGTYNGKDEHLGGHTFGGYSQKVVVDADHVLRIPENLDLAAVAPLLCAGITTWSPLRHWNVGSDSKVAVVGLGGLGHMAIKLAKGLGAEVTLFSRTPSKTEDAKQLGADHVVISTDEEQMKSVAGKFDVIIDTVPYDHDVNPYVATLNISGTLVLVGFIGKMEEALFTPPMIMGRRSVAGSVIGGIAETQEMLDFCGEHNIVSEIEMIKMQDINEAYKRMLKSDVRYRFVIDMKSLS